jgi:hypothetical protein
LAGPNESDDWAVQTMQAMQCCFFPWAQITRKRQFSTAAKCLYIGGFSAQPTCVSSSFRFKIAVFVFDFDVEY